MSELYKNNDSVIAKKSYVFALEIISTYKILIQDKKEFVLSKQLLRAGTSIGANVNEAVCAQSKKDFVHKLSIALKEARETDYWIHLLKDSEYINTQTFDNLKEHCTENIKILTSIILTTKQKYFKQSTNNS
jgi:four helix bundle protein